MGESGNAITERRVVVLQQGDRGWVDCPSTSQCLQDDELAGTRVLLTVEGNAIEITGSTMRKT